jgi:ElaB/YqjD/DUF883 family membrane-anchored ribosome-binding protein
MMAAESEPTAENRSPEEIQADIETTREELGETVGAIAEKADVKKQVKRKAADTKAKATAKKDEIQGKATAKAQEASAKAKEATPDSAQAGAQQAGEAAQRAGQQVLAAAQENPVAAAAGIAFAGGLLVGWFLGRR